MDIQDSNRFRRRRTHPWSMTLRLTVSLVAVAVVVWAVMRPKGMATVVSVVTGMKPGFNPLAYEHVAGSYEGGFMAIHKSPNGDVLLVDKYQIARCKDGDPAQFSVIYDSTLAASMIGLPPATTEPRVEKPGSLSDAIETTDYGLWCGTWQGRILNARGGRLALISSPLDDTLDTPRPTGRVVAMREYGGFIWVAAGTLWRITPAPGADTTGPMTGSTLAPEPFFAKHQVTALGLDADGDLLATSNEGVFRLDRNIGWVTVRGSDPQDGDAYLALGLGPDGRTLVGTANGLLFLSPDGTPTARVLGGNRIEVIAVATDGTLYLGSYKGGMYAGTQSHLQPVTIPDGLVSLLVHPARRLWIGIYDQATMVGDR